MSSDPVVSRSLSTPEGHVLRGATYLHRPRGAAWRTEDGSLIEVVAELDPTDPVSSVNIPHIASVSFEGCDSFEHNTFYQLDRCFVDGNGVAWRSRELASIYEIWHAVLGEFGQTWTPGSEQRYHDSLGGHVQEKQVRPLSDTFSGYLDGRTNRYLRVSHFDGDGASSTLVVMREKYMGMEITVGEVEYETRSSPLINFRVDIRFQVDPVLILPLRFKQPNDPGPDYEFDQSQALRTRLLSLPGADASIPREITRADLDAWRSAAEAAGMPTEEIEKRLAPNRHLRTTGP